METRRFEKEGGGKKFNNFNNFNGKSKNLETKSFLKFQI